jgi:hypothetical protein
VLSPRECMDFWLENDDVSSHELLATVAFGKGPRAATLGCDAQPVLLGSVIYLGVPACMGASMSANTGCCVGAGCSARAREWRMCKLLCKRRHGRRPGEQARRCGRRGCMRVSLEVRHRVRHTIGLWAGGVARESRGPCSRYGGASPVRPYGSCGAARPPRAGPLCVCVCHTARRRLRVCSL